MMLMMLAKGASIISMFRGLLPFLQVSRLPVRTLPSIMAGLTGAVLVSCPF